MNDQLWKAIQAFNLDEPDGEYPFSVRLAHEHNWTKNFTQKAITEYKKFMYLAATAGSMVSPSEITDIVWHQHLIFTDSYRKFCELLGRQVQHIPSTHSRDEPEKFRLARERTKMLYEQSFGKQPPDIWEWSTMIEPLQLTRSKTNINSLLVLFILLSLLLFIPLCKLLYPIYTQLNNPYFLIFYGLTFITTTFLLTRYNRQRFRQMVNTWPEYSFVHHLHPMELVYLKYSKLSYVIHGYMDQLVRKNTVRVDDRNNNLYMFGDTTLTLEEQAIVNTMKEHPDTSYRDISNMQMMKPVFLNIANTMFYFREELLNSTTYVRLYIQNLAVMVFLLSLGMGRLMTGTSRDKAVGFLIILLVVAVTVTLKHMKRIESALFETVIPDSHQANMEAREETGEEWQWAYLLLGMTALTSSFEPLASNIERMDRHAGGGNGCGSSCGSSCGSGCGGGCGGCGG